MLLRLTCVVSCARGLYSQLPTCTCVSLKLICANTTHRSPQLSKRLSKASLGWTLMPSESPFQYPLQAAGACTTYLIALSTEVAFLCVAGQVASLAPAATTWCSTARASATSVGSQHGDHGSGGGHTQCKTLNF